MAPLLSLPPETRLQILKELPVRDILVARGVSTEFRELIDEPENQTTLFKDREERELARLQKSARSLFDYNQDADFLEALQQFIASRGIRSDFRNEDTGYYHLVAFAVIWVHQTTDPPLELASYPLEPLTQDRVHHCIRIATDLLKLHVDLHMPGYFINTWHGLPIQSTRGCSMHDETKFVRRHSQRGVLSADMLRQMYRAIRNGEGSRFESCVHEGDLYYRALPEWPIMELAYPVSFQKLESDEAGSKIKRQKGCCWTEEFETMFPEVPKLPEATTYFAYCVKTESAYKRIIDAAEGYALSRAERTALLEELYIY